jgi:Phosphotransferase enzyme family
MTVSSSHSPYRQTLPSLLPDLPTLALGLRSVLCPHTDGSCQVTVLEREPNIYASTFPSEIVRCQLKEGTELHLLCKYAAGQSHNAGGHRGRVAYEAAVYREVLQPLQTTAPRFYGTYAERSSGEPWLLIEYAADGIRADDTPAPQAALRLAARWIGRFHAANEARLATAPFPFLSIYDPDYYRQWARRTVQFAGDWLETHRWLEPLCTRVEEFSTALAALRPTVIHGEYTPHNVLLRGEAVCPVDWESAAVAPGEIDLVSLVDRWPEEVARVCEQEYQRARWPEGPPPEFGRTLELARLYWDLRWLGDRPDWTARPRSLAKSLWRFEHLHATAGRLGLI